MTRAQKRALALGLRAEGKTRAQIAEAVGYRSLDAVTALLRDPEVRRELVRRDNSRRNAAKREWDRAHYRGRCACGALTAKPGVMLCAECHRDVVAVGRAMRQERIAELWAQGLKLREIAAELGSTKHSIGEAMARMRAEGWDLPRRYNWSQESLERIRAAARAK